MAMLQLTLQSLKELDGGKAYEAFSRHVHRAATDCMDRPADAAKRKVTLEVTLEPLMAPDGDCTEVAVQIQVCSAVPKHRTKPYSMGLRRNGVVVFNEDSLDSIDQTTLLPDEDN